MDNTTAFFFCVEINPSHQCYSCFIIKNLQQQQHIKIQCQIETLSPYFYRGPLFPNFKYNCLILLVFKERGNPGL